MKDHSMAQIRPRIETLHLGTIREQDCLDTRLSVARSLVFLGCLWPLVLVMLSCSGNDKLQESAELQKRTALLAPVRIAYVEIHESEDDSKRSRDVIVQALDSWERFFVTKDNYINEYPAFSPGGQLLAFASARLENNVLQRALGDAAPRGFYVFNLLEGTTYELGRELRISRVSEFPYPVGLCWSKDGSSLLFSNLSNRIYAISAAGDSLRVVMEARDVKMMPMLALSPAGDVIAFQYQREYSGPFGIGLFHLGDSSFSPIIESCSYVSICSWMRNGQQLMFVDSILKVYDLEKDAIRTIELMGQRTDFIVQECVSVDDSTLIMLCAKPKGSRTGKVSWRGSDIVKAEMRSKRIEWLSHDGVRREHLTIYSPKTTD